ncbi:MAG: DNA primase [Ferruginibacter sp.]|nr:DNA primase [Ferruginibacter sp.]
MISQESIQEIQRRIDIIDIIGTFVKLKKRGANYLGNCPFHNEKTPSFTVSPSKEIYKCFGCGKSGNTIGFLMDHEKYSYVETLRWLAERYNIDLKETETSPEFKALQHTADSLFAINHFARDFFTNTLFNSDEGTDIALSYLRERGFREETIKKFQLGFNPSSKNEFANTAISHQFNKELLLKTGIVVNRDDKLTDNYRGRIIFPIHNLSGKILGFGARVIKSNDRAPKYINTPENEIYVKSKLLYGSYFARTAIDKANECLLVEGYTDVISLHQAGIENVVASGGTSLTTDQIRLIKKYTHNLTIVYDGDNAGIKAALRGLDLAVEEGLNVNLVLIPDKEDPDSFVNKIGAAAFTDFIKKQKKDFILFQLEIALKESEDDSTKKSAVVNQIAETISKINKTEDFTRRQDYIKKVSEILKVEESGFNALVNKLIREKINKQDARFFPPNNVSQAIPEPNQTENENTGAYHELIQKDELHEQAVVRNLIEFGLKEWDENLKVADYLLSQIDESDLSELLDNKTLVDIINIYRDWYRKGKEPTEKNFLYHENNEIKNLIIKIMDVQTEISPRWKDHYEGYIATREDLYKEEIISTLTYLQLRKVKRLIADNQAELEKASNPEEQLICIETHQHLKLLEIELTKRAGTVIYK